MSIQNSGMTKKAPLFSDVTFSLGGSYSFNIVVDGETFLPFLQYDDEHNLVEFFCNCDEEIRCEHVALAEDFIGEKGLLHHKFKSSFFHALFQLIAHDSQYANELQNEHCNIKAKNRSGETFLKEIFRIRQNQNEQNSFQLASLSAEELELYKLGKSSPIIAYELSVWADLAKELFMQNAKIDFPQKELPTHCVIESTTIVAECKIKKEYWNKLVYALKNSPFKVVFSDYSTVQNLRYDPFKRKLFIKHSSSNNASQKKGQSVGDFYYTNRTFYAKKSAVLSQTSIAEKDIEQFLDEHSAIAKKFLAITKTQKKLKQSIYFSDKHLVIDSYLFEKGDLQKKDSAFFNSWVYIHNQGFFKIKPGHFTAVRIKVPRADLISFVQQHKTFFQPLKPFTIHLKAFRSDTTFRVDSSGLYWSKLKADNTLVIDANWLYIEGKGFYPKGQNSLHFPLKHVPANKIPLFIDQYRKSLELIPNFFSLDYSIHDTYFHIEHKTDRLVISPHIKSPNPFIQFDYYVYFKKRGFVCIDALKDSLFPVTTLIPPNKYSHFFDVQLPILSSEFLIERSTNIAPIGRYSVIEESATPYRAEGYKLYKVHWVIKTQTGQCNVADLIRAIKAKQFVYPSECGLFLLKEESFAWLWELEKNVFQLSKTVSIAPHIWIKFSLQQNIEGFKLPKHPSTPALKHFHGTLRPYQKTGLFWSWNLYKNSLSGLLCDEMGLGKTHQAIALIAASYHPNHRYLIVCPKSLLSHWHSCLEDALPNISTLILYSHHNTLAKSSIIIASYGNIRRLSYDIGQFEITILDEMQIIKNKSSAVHSAVRNIKTNMVLGLTGTPIENSLSDIKALFDVILPHYFPPVRIFRKKFLIPIEKEHDEEAIKSFYALVKPFILARYKEDVLKDLPKKNLSFYYCDLSLDQLKLYDEITRSSNFILERLKSADKIDYAHIFSILSQLKQLCNHPALVNKDIANYEQYASGKFELCKELILKALSAGKKVVLFSQYINMINIFKHWLTTKKIGFSVFTGQTKNRASVIEQFSQNDNKKVILVSLLAGGLGINLSAASVVIHYDRWWNRAREGQATDRVHRIGQNKTVQVFTLITKHTIEEHIHKIISRKDKLISKVFSNVSNDSYHFLTKDALIEIFEAMR